MKALTKKEGMDLTRDFEEEIAQLIQGERETIKITRDEFNDFRKAWFHCAKHHDIVGEAHFSGNVIYRYLPNHDENE